VEAVCWGLGPVVAYWDPDPVEAVCWGLGQVEVAYLGLGQAEVAC
jgi:hypothetical protein